MRKRQLSLVKEMSELLKQAHDSILKVISAKEIEEENLNAVFNLLSQCQSTAINMGNLIEESEGEGFATVKYLEDYCELVFSVNEDLQNNSGADNPDKVYKKLNKMLQKIDNSISHDIPLRREAVFLPYKASMWDSLESVWMAADADPDCDAYVIPIPYYDKNPDGSLREEHYEADKFPEGVPITHYSEYDFGKHHPDMIFIHNPYDYGNYVTTIHPFFYAEKMKQVTDCLVYIPYFATSGSMGEDKAWCPVYDYVDYIVIQSENYRKYYSPQIPDEKFLPFGSPKFDKVIRKCQNPATPPKDWSERAKGRTVFFYNTSLNGMLQNTVLFLKKMQYVFETFKNNEGACLLWRPHPLFESTLYAMRPECLEIFNALKEDFKKQENWIYDDTPCVEDTIAFCDAYIGDEASSIVSLFGVAGKPIYILRNNITRNIDENEWKTFYTPNIFDIREQKGFEKYILVNGRSIFEKNGNTYKFYCNVSEYTAPYQYMTTMELDNKILVFPLMRQEILIIEDKKVTEVINLKREKEGLCFIGFKVVNNYVFLIPHDYSSLVRIDVNSFEITYISGIRDYSLSKNGEKKHGAYWIIEDKLYFLSGDGSEIIQLDVNSLDYEVKKINNNELYVKAQYEEKNRRVWLFKDEGTQIAWLNIDTLDVNYIDYGKSNVKSYNRDTCKYCEKHISYSFFENGDEYILAPYWGNMFVKLDKNGNYIDAIETDFKVTDNNAQYNFNPELCEGYVINECGKQIYTSYIEGRQFELIDGVLVERDKIFDKNDILKNEESFADYNENLRYVCVEGQFNTLDKMISQDYLRNHSADKQIDKYKIVNASPDGDCGSKVYESL